jgi:hypothetical protein
MPGPSMAKCWSYLLIQINVQKAGGKNKTEDKKAPHGWPVHAEEEIQSNVGKRRKKSHKKT